LRSGGESEVDGASSTATGVGSYFSSSASSLLLVKNADIKSFEGAASAITGEASAT